VALAGPLVCGMSQAANDWCDRHVDAINEPNRPIPSGAGARPLGPLDRAGVDGAVARVGLCLGGWVFAATVVAVAAAWAYSAEPIRLKKNGWWGRGLRPLLRDAALVHRRRRDAGRVPDWEIVLVALLYGIGAHGIMTLNDFKAVEGDRAHGLASLPVALGPERAARSPCW
jgi:chlorophyll synthase